MVLAHQGTWRQSVSLDPNHTSSSLANFSLSHLPISLRSNRYPPHPTLFRNIMRPSIALFLAGICTVAGAVSTNLPAAVHKFPCHLTNETLHPLPICSDIVLANGTLPLDMLCIEHVKNIENSEIVSTPSGCTNPLFDQNTSAQQDHNAASRLPMRSKVRCASSQSEMSLLSNLGISNGAWYLSSLLMWNVVQCTQLKLIQCSGATEKAHVHNGTM
jgi:hypothetical protein